MASPLWLTTFAALPASARLWPAPRSCAKRTPLKSAYPDREKMPFQNHDAQLNFS